MKILLIMCMFLLWTTQSINAQSFTVFGSLALPQGDFGDDDFEDDDAGLALTGFGGGAEYSAPLGDSPGLYWAINGSVLFNGVDDDASIDVGSWINIPILGGLKYQPESPSNVAFYGTVLAGINFVMVPDVEISWEGTDGLGTVKRKREYSLDSVTGFAFAIGGGIVVNKKYNIGLRYFSMGKTKSEGTYKSTYDPDIFDYSHTDDISGKKSVSLLLLTVGMNLQ